VRHARQGSVAAARDAVNSGWECGGLLSPACASFDHYRNFEIRGDACETCSELPGIVMTIKGGLLMLVSRSDREFCALVVHG
jgi:hypothetical protein